MDRRQDGLMKATSCPYNWKLLPIHSLEGNWTSFSGTRAGTEFYQQFGMSFEMILFFFSPLWNHQVGIQLTYNSDLGRPKGLPTVNILDLCPSEWYETNEYSFQSLNAWQVFLQKWENSYAIWPSNPTLNNLARARKQSHSTQKGHECS